MKMKTLCYANTKDKAYTRRNNTILVILHTLIFVIQCNCEIVNSSQNDVKNNSEVNPSDHCHSCYTNSINLGENNKINYNEKTDSTDSMIEELIMTAGSLTEEYFRSNRTDQDLENEVENMLDEALDRDRYEILEGIEIKSISKIETATSERRSISLGDRSGKALFNSYTQEYRLLQKIKHFVNTHILSINLPKAAKMISNRSFGLKKFFLPLLIGAQVFKSILLAMFLPSILGSFGKILGKGISQLSASSSQASFPPMNAEDPNAYNQDKDFMGYETDPAGALVYPNGQYDVTEQNGDPGGMDLSRFGFGGQKASYLPVKNGYYKNQMASAANNYKVFQKIPSSSMILSNYDPFYSPLLSRLDGIFARLGLTPSENSLNHGAGAHIGGQSVGDIKLESCREQLVCLMYSSPAKYAPYSNLVSAQLSRELNELRRPVSDNPEILRFFRYMRAARRGQEGVDCLRAHPACLEPAAPAHTMIAAYQDINKLVTARKLRV